MVQDSRHLAHVPSYLIPRSMRSLAAESGVTSHQKFSTAAKRSHVFSSQNRVATGPQRKLSKDPLQTFEDIPSPSNQSDIICGEDVNRFHKNITSKTNVGTSFTSGRREWKVRHRKGDFRKRSEGRKDSERGVTKRPR